MVNSPKIFISSTCYDLSDARASIKSFLQSLKYIPVMSDDPAFPVSSQAHSHDACLEVVKEHCDIFILIIGGRYGGSYKDEGMSITNKEYEIACDLRVPVFVYVKQEVYNSRPLYNKNKDGDFSIYVDDTRIYDFINSIARKEKGNWIFQFQSVDEIIKSLSLQFSALFKSLLKADMKRIVSGISDEVDAIDGRIMDGDETESATDDIEFQGLFSECRLNYEKDLVSHDTGGWAHEIQNIVDETSHARRKQANELKDKLFDSLMKSFNYDELKSSYIGVEFPGGRINIDVDHYSDAGYVHDRLKISGAISGDIFRVMFMIPSWEIPEETLLSFIFEEDTISIQEFYRRVKNSSVFESITPKREAVYSSIIIDDERVDFQYHPPFISIKVMYVSTFLHLMRRIYPYVFNDKLATEDGS